MKTETLVIIGVVVVAFLFLSQQPGFSFGLPLQTVPLPSGGRDFRAGPPPAPPNSVGTKLQEIDTGIKAAEGLWKDFKGLFN